MSRHGLVGNSVFHQPEPDKAQSAVNAILNRIYSLTSGNFSGKLHLTFENGKVVHIVEEKYIKP